MRKWFGGKKNKKNTTEVAMPAGQVIGEQVTTTKTTTTTTLVDQGLQHGHHHHQHGPLVANPYAQPAHGQIFVPANTAVQANPETGALLPASQINGPVILPTGPKVVPIATNYPAGQAGPMVIPPSGGFINNSGNPYLTQQTYGPAGVLPTAHPVAHQTYVQEREVIAGGHNAAWEKEQMKEQKRLEKEQSKLEKEQLKHEKKIEKEERAAEKAEMKLERQMEKDQAKLEKQMAKDQEKLAKDQAKLQETLAKDQERAINNEIKLQNNIEKNEAKLQNQIVEHQMTAQELEAQRALAAHQQQVLASQPAYVAPVSTGVHGVKHVYAEETKQDAYTGQVLDRQVYHNDQAF